MAPRARDGALAAARRDAAHRFLQRSVFDRPRWPVTAMGAEVRSQGKPRGAHDLIIAATAKAFDRTIITADRSAFRDLPGVEVRSPT